MTRRIVFVATGNATIAAALEDGEVVWLLAERDDLPSRVGDLCAGRVSRLLPGMDAAFVEFGDAVAGYLHRADTPPGTTLQPGDKVLVQVSRDALDEKGARLTMKPALVSRWLVWMPYGAGVAVSTRIIDADERMRLAAALADVDGGVVVRTAAAGLDAAVLQQDLASLKDSWAAFQTQAKSVPAATMVRPELGFSERVVRDLGHADDEVIDVDNVTEADRGKVLATVKSALQRRVELPSGGYLVIDRTEAMTVVDVNTGAFVGRTGQAATVLQTNLEAAEALARELRLRDLGGVIVVDFIDMQARGDRERVLAALQAATADDAMRVHVGGISPLGLVELTRKRVRRSLAQLLATPCSHCDGHGTVGAT